MHKIVFLAVFLSCFLGSFAQDTSQSYPTKKIAFSKDTISIFINMYDYGELKAPVGFSIKRLKDITRSLEL